MGGSDAVCFVASCRVGVKLGTKEPEKNKALGIQVRG